MLRFGACVVRVVVFSAVVYVVVQTNVARNAFRDSIIIPQHIHDFIWHYLPWPDFVTYLVFMFQ